MHLLQNCQQWTERKQMYRFWAITEIRRAQEKAHELTKLQEEAERVKNESRSFILYSQEQKVLAQYNNLYYSMLNGPDVVIDMGFEEQMNARELSDATNQVKYAYSYNKSHREPVHLKLCNLQQESKTSALLERNLRNLYSEKPITVTSESYLDIYPREKLVYLTSDSRNDLSEYKDDEVYIIGGFVDKPKRPLAMYKTKEEGIKTAALPIHRYYKGYVFLLCYCNNLPSKA